MQSERRQQKKIFGVYEKSMLTMKIGLSIREIGKI